MLLVKKSTLPQAGKGLFTTRTLRKGQQIIEYKGRLCKWKDVKHTDGHNGYLLRVTHRMAIDAQRTRAKGRYANDAGGSSRKKGLRNNAEYVSYGTRCFIEATRTIKAGEEILVGYGRAYWALQRSLKKL
ncbi:MAG: SET domain-containing protein [Cyclobacteriaceae bacterium]|nr:SET domain-containing protein [Cyclobacteriaceae bacterium]